MADTVPFFTGATNGSAAKHQVKLFTRYLVTRNLAGEDRKAAELFATFLDGAAETWLESQPQEIRTSWTLLQRAFLDLFEGGGGAEGAKEARYVRFAAHLGPSLDLVRDEEVWDTWLQQLFDLGNDVAPDFVAQQALSFMAWQSLPYELQSIIAQPRSTISDFVNACRAIPRTTYERVLTNHDQRKELSKQLRQQQQRENETRKLRGELAEMRKAIGALARPIDFRPHHPSSVTPCSLLLQHMVIQSSGRLIYTVAVCWEKPWSEIRSRG